MAVKNIFVPLNKEVFGDFSKGKTFEIRKSERGWNRNQIYAGRSVTLSCGYSGARLYGTIGKVVWGSLDKILKEIPFEKIAPSAKNIAEAKKAILDILGRSQEYVAFEIILNGN